MADNDPFLRVEASYAGAWFYKVKGNGEVDDEDVPVAILASTGRIYPTSDLIRMLDN